MPHKKRRMKRHAVVQPSDPSYRLIPLTQGQNAIVDSEDLEWLSQWNWHALWCPDTKSFYAKRVVGRGTLGMHSAILRCSPTEQGDHINHDTLDNRKQNLRKSTHQQNGTNRKMNAKNTSGFRGVSWIESEGKWRAALGCNGRQRIVGRYKTAEAAACAYDEAARINHGAYANLNFPTQAP